MKTAIGFYRSAKYNHLNYELIEQNDVVNTFLLLMKRLRFCCSENYSLFWLFIQISCVSRSSTTLCLSYCSFGSSCKITAVVGLFERLLLRTAVHSLTTTPIFFFLDPFWCTFITSMFFCRIVYMRHNLNEDQIVGRSVIKTGMLNHNTI